MGNPNKNLYLRVQIWVGESCDFGGNTVGKRKLQLVIQFVFVEFTDSTHNYKYKLFL